MSKQSPDSLQERIEAADQRHVLRWVDHLSPDKRARLAAQLEAIDFPQIRTLWQQATGDSAQVEKESPQDRARRATAPAGMIPLPAGQAAAVRWSRAREHGQSLLNAGKIGVLIVAGGEGTRLQFPHPKGMYPIGPVTDRTLFQWLAEQILARSRRAGRPIPCYIMTSDATHAETVEHFADHAYFGLPKDDVYFFRQGTMPVVNLSDGRLLMSARGEIATSPDGHGGLVAALQRAGLVDDMRLRGLQHIFYMQVDNPTVLVCDPAFLGFHALEESEISTKVVAKRNAAEKMGVLCDVDGVTQIIEYSDMPDDVAAGTDASGKLVHWAGNTAIHCFAVDLLERIARDAGSLPFHIARKHVPYIDDNGDLQEPTPETGKPNACKFEKFIFDALPLAKRTLVVEADRAREFNPLKDRTGENSPEHVKQALTRVGRSWLIEAGVDIPESASVEISPLAALEADDLKALGPDQIHRRLKWVEAHDGPGVVLS
ncbi:MAG: UDPGP type 1 family protein [Planctomycetaceae bacterium]|nr:UDPGP type 1 family protein [Planctomycetaceae bacterium]